MYEAIYKVKSELESSDIRLRTAMNDLFDETKKMIDIETMSTTDFESEKKMFQLAREAMEENRLFVQAIGVLLDNQGKILDKLSDLEKRS